MKKHIEVQPQVQVQPLIINNERICRFYKENPHIHFESVNLIFIDLFDKLLTDMNSTMNASINSQILTNVNDLCSSMDFLKNSIDSHNTDLKQTILLKYSDIKKDYIDELNTILSLNHSERMAPLLDKNNSILIDKTATIITDIIPKTQTHYYQQIQDSIRYFHKSISDDTRVLLNYVDNNTIKDYVTNFEMKSSMMLQNIQQPIHKFISASEERITQNIKNLKETTTMNQTVETKIMTELTELITQFRAISPTNNQPNTHMSSILTKLYPTADISKMKNDPNPNEINVHMMKRFKKAKIIIQSSIHEDNVNEDEIAQFNKISEQNMCNGIFISQNSGFVSKSNYHIEINNRLISVYIHNGEFDPNKIKAAVNIIDHLYNKLNEFNNTSDFKITIEKEMLDEINKEYQSFIQQKDTIITAVKESHKNILSQIDDFKFPCLEKYLSTKFSPIIYKQGFKCDICKLFNANNLKALAAHKRGCTRKNLVVQIDEQKPG